MNALELAERRAWTTPYCGPLTCWSTPSAHIWGASSVAALDAFETKYAQRGKTVEITGLNDPSAHLHGKLTGELAASH